MFCRNCGVENIDGAKFCKSCGTPLKTNEDVVNKENVQSGKGKKSSRKLMYILGVVVLLIVIIAAVFIGMQTKTTKEYNSYLASAEKFLEEMDYEQAEAMYLNAIAIAPKKLEPYVKLANVYIMTGEADKAEIIMNQAEEANAKGDEEVEQSYEKLKKVVKEADSLVGYEWVVEPTIEADDIYYVPDFKSYGDYYEVETLNINYRQIRSSYAVIRQGERLGLIAMNGEMLGGMDYNWIGAHGGSYRLWRIEPKWEAEFETEWDIYWQEGNELVADLDVGDFGAAAFYYCDGLHELSEHVHEDNVREPSVPIPVKQADNLIRGEYGYEYEKWGHLKGNYGIYYDGRMRTDFIYEECGSYSEGLMAVCQNGKWGYVNEDGDVIIPVEYDASWPQFQLDWDSFMDKQGVRDYCYAAAEGYVVLCKDNQYELRNTEGQLVIPSGVFEIIRPVFNGKCWVKQNGKWGVIELVEKNTGEDNTEDYQLLESLPGNYYFSSGAGGWGTDLIINSEDGTFSGEYYDYNMGDSEEDYPNGTKYEAIFKGKFSEPKKIDEYTYVMKIKRMETEMEEAQEYYEDGMRIITSAPYGLEAAEDIYIYLPGSNIYTFPEYVTEWLLMSGFEELSLSENGCVIYSPEDESVFISY